MQYLMVLLLMIGVFVLMVAMVLGASYCLGSVLSGRVRSPQLQGCDRCQADRDWYEELPIWKRNLVQAWWIANRYQCSLKGCR